MEEDVSWKEFFQDDERYADVINAVGCKGRQMVTGKDLQEADSQSIFGRMYGWKPSPRGRKRKKQYGVKVRDSVRRVAFGVNYVIVGIENQELVDYSLPLRCMIYDAGEYEKQLGKIRKQLRKNPKGLSAGEYLYGFGKDSRLFPVVTFVLYGGKEKWSGPTTLHGMLELAGIPEDLREMIPDYVINLVEIREFKDTGVFKTDVKQVFDFIRCSGNKQELRELIEKDSSYQHMEEDAYEVATKYVRAEELIAAKDYYKGKDGKVDMCQALKELLADERSEGRAEGRTEGRAEGRAEGYLDGCKEEKRKLVINMLKKGMEDRDILEIAECEAELIEQVRREMGKAS